MIAWLRIQACAQIQSSTIRLPKKLFLQASKISKWLEKYANDLSTQEILNEGLVVACS
jgi:hypothetical protein